jgi:hypothetical protein
MKMMLDYLLLEEYDEQYLYDSYAGGDIVDADEMRTGLNNEIHGNPPDWTHGYFFGHSHNVSYLPVLRYMCIMIDYPLNYYVPEWPYPGHPMHTPAALPIGGSYDNWLAVSGIHTNQDCWPADEIVDLEIYGFWFNDPSPSGIGDKTYITAQRLLDNYYFSVDGEYRVVCDPPYGVEIPEISGNTEIIPSEEKFNQFDKAVIKNKFAAPMISLLADKSAENAARSGYENIASYDKSLGSLGELSDIIYNSDECIVIFSCGTEVIIDISNGALLEIKL